MPAKSKTKTKGKGTKAKKKAEGEPDKATLAKQAVVTAKLWESKYIATEDSKQKYRENALQLVGENESLQSSVYKTEQDTIEVIAYLKKEEARMNMDVKDLKQELKESHVKAARERELLTKTYDQKIYSLQLTLEERTHEVAMLQTELDLLKEFRTGRNAMEKEIRELKECLQRMELDHRKIVSKMEEKFMEEKHRLQKEANRQVAGLAEKAHELAVHNLDQKTKSIYRENIQLAEALSIHLKDSEELRKVVDRLKSENGELKFNHDFNQQMAESLVSESAKYKKTIKQLQSKAEGLEVALMKMVAEFEEEKGKVKNLCSSKTQQLQCEVAVLRRNAQVQAKESNHVKLLAKQLLDQRTDVEDFFITALTEVKAKAKHSQNDYKKAAFGDYQQRLKEAQEGQTMFPRVKTFNPLPTSTNSVYGDLKQASMWGTEEEEHMHMSLSDLTWEQKEQVLRVMFAKMNGEKQKTASTSRDSAQSGLELVVAKM